METMEDYWGLSSTNGRLSKEQHYDRSHTSNDDEDDEDHYLDNDH